jgi:hypothetical protein
MIPALLQRMRCLSCKNNQSIERCLQDSATNFMFCKMHMRAKCLRHWITFNPIIYTQICIIQALFRGFSIRNRLQLAGKGVLKRSLCHNDEEMVTMETKTEIHPFNYFSIEEDGNVWWFDQRSMIEWSQKALEIKNPFTRRTLKPEDATRLRLLYIIRKKKGIPFLHNEQTELPGVVAVRDLRWIRIVQILHEFGFAGTVHPNHFCSLTYTRLHLFLGSLIEDTRWWMSKNQKRLKYHTWLKSIRNTMGTYNDLAHLSRDVAGILISIINDLRRPEDFVFFILSAVVRTELVAAVL